MRIFKGTCTLAVGLSIAAVVAVAMATAPAAEFEAVSVKLSTSGQHGVWTDGSPGQVRMMGMSLAELIAEAYHVKDYQVDGAERWIKNLRYDVMAKVPPEAAKLADKQRWEQIRAMGQTLLAERFKLEFHRETRELTAYELVVGKGGTKLRELGPDSGDNVRVEWKHGTEFSARQMRMSQLVEILMLVTHSPVVDRTGITGVFDIRLEWAPESVAVADDNRPSLQAAVQEQLGLKLEGKKLPMEVLVVDHAERASGN